MSFLSRLLGLNPPAAPAEPPQVVVVKPQGKQLGAVLWPPHLRRGMWVVYGDYVGILTDVNRDGIASVMLVHDDGTNLQAVTTLFTNLRQADLFEIPEPRRPALGVALRLGYAQGA